MTNAKSERNDERRTPAGLWLGAAAAWLVTCAAALSVAVLGLLSVERLRSPVEIGAAPVALVVGQVFFLIVLWPLFERRAAQRDLAGALARLASLLLLSAPLVVLAARLAEVDAWALVRSQVLVLMLGVTAAGAVRLPRFVTWYYPTVFLLSAVVPFAAYLLYQEGRVATGWAEPVSPLWAAGNVAAGMGSAAPLIVFGCVGVASIVAALLSAALLSAPRAVGVDADQA
jgi:hypothetical protein